MTARNPLVLVSGAIRELPTGDTVNGASGGGGGMHVLLSELDLSAAASGVFGSAFITNTYKTYLLRWEEIIPSFTGALQVQVSPDNGVTWRTTNYFTSEVLWGTDTSFTGYSNAILNSGFLLQRAGTVDAAIPAQGHMYLYGLANAALKKTAAGEGVVKAADNHIYRSTTGGYYSVAEAINAIRIISVTGGVTLTGRLTLYGVSDTGGGSSGGGGAALLLLDGGDAATTGTPAVTIDGGGA